MVKYTIFGNCSNAGSTTWYIRTVTLWLLWIYSLSLVKPAFYGVSDSFIFSDLGAPCSVYLLIFRWSTHWHSRQPYTLRFTPHSVGLRSVDFVGMHCFGIVAIAITVPFDILNQVKSASLIHRLFLSSLPPNGSKKVSKVSWLNFGWNINQWYRDARFFWGFSSVFITQIYNKVTLLYYYKKT